MENEKNLEETQEQTTPVEEVISAESAESFPQYAANQDAASVPADLSGQQAEPAEEAASTGNAEEAGEPAPVEAVVPGEESKTEEKKVTPGKMALVIGAIVVVIAVIVALLMGGSAGTPAVETTEPEELETTVSVPTIPADGNPDDETCKGTYTVTDEEAVADADVVVATIGEHTLTNGQLRTFYWMQVQSFLSSDYGTYMMYYGMLDYTQSLDTQTCALTESGTWQQFFLKEALNTWQNYCALKDGAVTAGLELSDSEREYLEGIEENLAANAEYYGLESVEELLKHNIGPGSSVEDYTYFQELLMLGNKYYDEETAKVVPTQEDLEAFFAEHETEYADSGITKDGKFVDVRHVLFTPEGGTTDESGVTTYSDEEWADCEAEAQNVLNAWTKGDRDEESFAAMANAYSQDPGSNTNGGLYEDVQQGQMVEEFDAWCFDEKREPGHYGIVKTTYGYHLMYFVDSTPIWEYYTKQDLISEKTSAMMEELVAQYPMEVDYSAITLGYVNMAG